MRGVLLFVLGMLFAGGAAAQVAPDISAGTSAEELIRIYGWPKGHSISEDREIWMYDGFQVLLQDRRVVSVAPLPGKKTTPPVRNAAPVKAPAAQPAVRPLNPRPLIQYSAPASSTSATAPASRNLSTSVATRANVAKPVDPSPSVVTTMRGWPAIAAGVVLVTSFIVGRQKIRKKAAQKARAAVGPTEGTKPKSWEDTVRAQLDRHTAMTQRRSDASPPKLDASNADGGASDRTAPDGDSEVPELSAELLDRLEWKRLELLMCRYFSATGFQAECTSIGADGGIDVRLHRDGMLHGAVQCKAWSRGVGVKHIRELFGVIMAEQIPHGYFVASRTFSPDARAWAEGKPLTLIDGNDLLRRLQALEPATLLALLAEVTAGDYTTPTCPSCDVKLVLRTSSTDQSRFWGCTRYPRCQYTMTARSGAVE